MSNPNNVALESLPVDARIEQGTPILLAKWVATIAEDDGSTVEVATGPTGDTLVIVYPKKDPTKSEAASWTSYAFTPLAFVRAVAAHRNPKTTLSDQINSLPEPLRTFVHDLETRADPAGDVRRAVIAEENLAAVMRSLGLDTPWPVHEVLQRLADAADHLLDEHNCDAHGWEGVVYARDAARRIIADFIASGRTG